MAGNPAVVVRYKSYSPHLSATKHSLPFCCLGGGGGIPGRPDQTTEHRPQSIFMKWNLAKSNFKYLDLQTGKEPRRISMELGGS